MFLKGTPRYSSFRYWEERFQGDMVKALERIVSSETHNRGEAALRSRGWHPLLRKGDVRSIDICIYLYTDALGAV